MSEIYHFAYYLCGRPTFFSEVGRIFDVTNSLNFYNASETEKEADMRAISLDWLAVGQDIKLSMNDYEQ